MAYTLSAIIGKEGILHRFTSRYQYAKLVCLFAIISLLVALSVAVSWDTR